jgi:chromosome segregation ATPase
MARMYMSMRECWVTDRRREAQEEVVADLHSCLEQLTYRCTEMETKIEKCKQNAVYHMQLSKKESAPAAVTREKTRAAMYMQDRRRLQGEHDKALRSMHMLQQQIDSIVSSHVDMVIVDAMRGFNATAARMALPAKTQEIEKLSDSLADRHHEVQNLQEALGGVTFGADDDLNSEESLMRELDELLEPAVKAPEQPPVVEAPVQEPVVKAPVQEPVVKAPNEQPLVIEEEELPSPPAMAKPRQLIVELT